MVKDTKICPYCGETIKSTAKKCRFCGEWFDDEDRIAHGQAVASGTVQPQKETTNGTGEKEEILSQVKQMPDEQEVGIKSSVDDESDRSSMNATVEDTPTPPNATDTQNSVNESGHKKTYIIIGIVVVLFVLPVCAVSASSSNDGQSQEQSQNYSGTDTSSSSVTEADSESIEQRKAEVKKRVEDIYNEVFSNESDIWPNFEEKFFTEDFYAIYEEAVATSIEGETSFIDHDIWSQSQDAGKMTIEVKDVSISSPNSKYAFVSCDLISDGKFHKAITLMMRNEDGEWRISDIKRDEAGEWEKEIIKSQLSEYKDGRKADNSCDNSQHALRSNTIWKKGHYENYPCIEGNIVGTISNGGVASLVTLNIKVCQMEPVWLIYLFLNSKNQTNFYLDTSVSVLASNGRVYEVLGEVNDDPKPAFCIVYENDVKGFLNVLNQGHFTLTIVSSNSVNKNFRCKFVVDDETTDVYAAINKMLE